MQVFNRHYVNFLTILLSLCFIVLGAGRCTLCAQAQVRIKDISSLSGDREYQVLGYGLVTGLTGTGDKSEMSVEMVRGMLQNMGMQLSARQIASQNVAAVIVSGMLPPYARAGETFDITISSIGDAKSLQGGVLLPTLLKAGDGQIYAVAQGKVSIGGFEASRGGSGAQDRQKNHLTVGYISNGAITERGVDDSFARNGKFSILLNEKDSVLTRQVKEAVDRKYDRGWAKIINPGNVEITVPESMKDDPVSFAANIENLTLTIDEPNRVVINERTGTVIVGNNVRISRVVISHNGIQIAVDSENPPGAQARGKNKKMGSLTAIEGETTVDDLVEALNAIGASPKDLIAIFEAINAAGALHGELKLM